MSDSRPKQHRRRFVVNPRYQMQFAILLVIFQFNVGILYQGIVQYRVRSVAEQSGSIHEFLQANLWNQVLPATLLVSAGVAVLVYLLGLFISSTMVGPIPRLSEALYRIGQGDFSPRLRFRPGDALEDLADDVNAMAVALDARYGVRKPEAAGSRSGSSDQAPAESEPVSPRT